MPFPFDKYPWLNFQELNLAYFIKHFREIFEQWDELLHEMYDWKDATDAELAEWKNTVETGISSWETGLTASLEQWKSETESGLATWKTQTESDIETWKTATLAALDAWKTATTAVFEQIRTEAAASATAAAGSASSAQTALAGAQAAQAAAEAAAAGIQSELSQIQTNTADIADLKTQLNDKVLTERTQTNNNYTDFDAIIKNGVYLVNSSLAHGVNGATSEMYRGTLVVMGWDHTSQYAIVQCFYENINNTYFRTLWGESWSDWKRVANHDLLNQINAISRSVNILPSESLFARGYYLDLTDGVTHIANANVQMSDEFSTNGKDYLFVRQKYSASSTSTFLLYCYDKDGNYLGYASTPFSTIGITNSYFMRLKDGTAKVRLYTNDYYVTADDICISREATTGFLSYGEERWVNRPKDAAEAKSVNILDNFDFYKRGYYIDLDDGTTHVSYANASISDRMETDKKDYIYIRQIYSDASTAILLFYCYDESGNYLGQVNTTFKVIGTSNYYRMDLKPGTHSIIVYTNNADVDTSKICVSYIPTEKFYYYNEQMNVVVPENVLFGNNKLFGLKIANFGDSIFGNKRPPEDVSTFIEIPTGATAYNFGFGGCRMAKHSLSNFDAFSMYRLAYAIANNDFSVQDAAITASNALPAGDPNKLLSYYTDSLNLLKNTDFDNIDIITIAYGTNDLTGDIAIDNAQNESDTDTFCGALRYSLNLIMTAFPQIHIFVCSPTWRCWLNAQYEITTTSDEYENGNNDSMKDFITAENEVANNYHVKYIDNYNIGINRYNRLHWFPSNDGTHQNAAGAKLIAENMINELY